MVVLLKVPQEVSGVQVASSRLMLLMLLMGRWSCRCLHPDVVVALSGVACVLTCSRGSCSMLLLPACSFIGVGVLALHALFICFSILRWYIRRDDQDLAI
jgi:hypothetical protein